MIFFTLVWKSAGTPRKFSNPMWREVKCRANRNFSYLNKYTPKRQGYLNCVLCLDHEKQNVEYLNSFCIFTWYAQKRQDIWRYLNFVYNFTDKGKSGRNLQRLASRGTADQLYFQARSLYCLTRATCFGFFLHLSSGTGITIEEKINTWYTKH